MSFELSLDPPRQEGRLARTGSRDSTPILPASPDRTRDPGDFSLIFHNRTETRSAFALQPDSAAADPFPRVDTADAAEPEELLENADSLTDWIESGGIADPRAGSELLMAAAPQNASDPDSAAPELASGMVPVALRAAEISRIGAEITAPRSNGQEPAARTPPPQIPSGHGAVALMTLRGAPAATPDVVPSGVAPIQAVPDPAAPSATVASPAGPSAAAVLPSTVTKPLPRDVASAPTSAAARFSAALTDGTTQLSASAIPSRLSQTPLLQPLARSEAFSPSVERTIPAGPTQTTVKAESGALPPPASTAAPVLTQPLVTPQFLALAPRPTDPTDQRTGERRLMSHIGTQLLQAVTTTGPNTELKLNPVELGRVRLNLQAIDSTITVTIIAERPETADLMRRHVETLAQEFRALGYQDVNVSVGQRQTGGGQGSAPDRWQNEPQPVPDPVADQTLPQPPHNRPGLSASGSLDLRL